MPLITIITSIVTLAAAGNVLAQDRVFTADIPFDFIVEGHKMPAGSYEVEVAPGTTNPPVLAIETESPSKDEIRYRKVFAVTTPADRIDDRQPKLIFEKVGDVHFLAKVVPDSGAVKKVMGAPER